MTKPICDVCTQPIVDQARLCTRCSTLLERTLGDVPALVDELRTTRFGQANTGGVAVGIIVRTEDDRMPWNQRASEAERDLLACMVGLVHLIVKERGLTRPAGTPSALASFLTVHVDWLRHQPNAQEIFDEVRGVVRAARAAIDRAPDTQPLGRCGFISDDARAQAIVDGVPAVSCPGELRARRGAQLTSCHTCGREVDVAERLTLMAKLAEDYLLTASELTTAVTSIARPIPKSTIATWCEKKWLLPRGKTEDGRDLFLVRDVLDLLARNPKEQKAG